MAVSVKCTIFLVVTVTAVFESG